MKEIKKYFDLLKRPEGATLSELPYGTKKAEYTITFVLPVLGTSEGFYKMIVPGMVMNRMHKNVRCIFVGMQMFDPTLAVNDYDVSLKQGILKLTNHIVFPFVSYDLADILIECKKANPNIKFSYLVDFNYYHTPDSSRYKDQYKTQEAFDIIERNISMVNRVFCSNATLSDFLFDRLKEKLAGSGTKILYSPILFDKHYINKLEESPGFIKRKKFCIGIIASDDHFSDINFIRPVLNDFMNRHGDRAEIVIIDYNGIHKGKNYLKSISFEYIPRIDPFVYYQGILDLAFSVVLIPARDNLFNTTSKNYTKWLELTNMGIPVIMPDMDPYNKVVKHNNTGILAGTTEDWVNEINIVMTDKIKPEEIQKSAYLHAMNYNIEIDSNLSLLHNLFVI